MENPPAPPSVVTSLKVPLAVDIVVIIALAVQWGTNMQRMDQLERQIVELKAAQITDGRIVRVEEKVQSLTDQVKENNSLLRAFIEKQPTARTR